MKHVITRDFSFRNLTILREAISAKSWYLFSWWQFEILLLWTFDIFMMTSRDFVTNRWNFHDDSRDFYDGRSRLCCEWVGFLWSQVEILLLTVEIFLMAGQDFHDGSFGSYYKWSRFSWWQVKILLWTVALHTWRGAS